MRILCLLLLDAIGSVAALFAAWFTLGIIVASADPQKDATLEAIAAGVSLLLMVQCFGMAFVIDYLDDCRRALTPRPTSARG